MIIFDEYNQPCVDNEKIRELVDSEFGCDHATKETRRLLDAAGKRHFRLQCLRCGDHSETVRAETVPAAQRDSLPLVDRTKAERWRKASWERRSALYGQAADRKDEILAERAAAESQEWRDRYNERLARPDWQVLRRRVFERADGMCEGCAKWPATECHHETYKHLGCEFLFELKAMCDICHRRYHGNRSQDVA